ncbi:MAG: prepilin-type N-terminal cleavage/methylation domain-containing protein [Candidatus Eisenbacteria bacterium]|nr:prepilin-type N-terminal cleavage/methylation domain-containing protein [Candidatus Eisenbacteria bacterium]
MKLGRANILVRLRQDRAGFSLVELLMAIVFIGIGVMAVAGLFPLATKNVNDAKLLSTALGRAQEKLEELQVAGFSSAVMSTGMYADTAGTYVRTWAVRDSVPNPGTKQVTVSVSWPTNRGGESVTLTTYVAR